MKTKTLSLWIALVAAPVLCICIAGLTSAPSVDVLGTPAYAQEPQPSPEPVIDIKLICAAIEGHFYTGRGEIICLGAAAHLFFGRIEPVPVEGGQRPYMDPAVFDAGFDANRYF